jgi:hypothetical protein
MFEVDVRRVPPRDRLIMRSPRRREDQTARRDRIVV